MKTLTTFVVFMSMACFMVACESKPATPPPMEAPKADAPHKGGGMALTPEGKKFDPPVKSEALPDGAWYCDMGTVHYARSEMGDHTCPVCKMKLKEKTTAQ